MFEFYDIQVRHQCSSRLNSNLGFEEDPGDDVEVVDRHLSGQFANKKE